MHRHPALPSLLKQVAAGELTVEQALDRLEQSQDRHLGFARVDHDRNRRCGFPEVVFCPGKTPAQVAQIVEELTRRCDRVLATRADAAVHAEVEKLVPEVRYHAAARAITWEPTEQPRRGLIAVVAAGTSDIPVAEEARVTADIMGAHTETFYDVGVAGIHRLLAVQNRLQEAHALVVVAGMEGALPSVVGGLVAQPVIAVPTSIGYGASFGGLAALLAMLNSCAAGVSVVNIDNGFGAGYSAALINQSAGLKDAPARAKSADRNAPPQ